MKWTEEWGQIKNLLIRPKKKKSHHYFFLNPGESGINQDKTRLADSWKKGYNKSRGSEFRESLKKVFSWYIEKVPNTQNLYLLSFTFCIPYTYKSAWFEQVSNKYLLNERALFLLSFLLKIHVSADWDRMKMLEKK